MFESAFQSIRSLIIGDPEKCVSGEVVQIKSTDSQGNETNKYAASTIAEITLKKPKKDMEIDFDSVDSIIERIEYVTNKTRFSSKFVNVDEITGKEYDETCPELRLHEIPGSQLIYYPPAGVVYCHNDSMLLFRCVCIDFMILHRILPFKITSLNENQVYKIKRSTGFFQRSYLDYNSGLRISRTNNKWILNIGFNSDEKQIISESNPFIEGVVEKNKPTLSYNKCVIVDDFCQINNISKIVVNCNSIKFTQDEIDSQTESYPALVQVMEEYNNKLDTYIESFDENEFLEFI